MEPLLQVSNLKIVFDSGRGTVQAVGGVSFHVEPGQTVALVGESGCGKSVTAKSIMGLIQKPGRILPGSSIRFAGRELTELDDAGWSGFRGKDCSFVFQDALAALNPTQQVGKQVEEILRNHCRELSPAQRRERAMESLTATGITDGNAVYRKYPHQLSGGQRQRVMIAMAMAANPRLLIADEPTTSLDVTIQAQILEKLRDLQRQSGMSILLITHDLGIVSGLADRIIVMYAGKIVESGTRDQVLQNPQHPYTRALLETVPRLSAAGKTPLRTIPGVVPDLANLPEGCAFCRRCAHAMNICANRQPVPEETEDGHLVSCWMLEAQRRREESHV